MWHKIKELTDKHGYMSGVDRMSDRVKKTGEIFTPTDLVIQILKEIDINKFAPGKTIIDPTCGDGQFLTGVKWLKVFAFDMSEEDALKDIYGVDLMRDNVDLCKKRLGGGTIIMGNTLDPGSKLDGQTDSEHEQMKRIFLSQISVLDVGMVDG